MDKGTKINHDLRSVDGGTIYHLQEIAGASGAGNLELPNIFAEDSAPKYPIGTRFVLGDRTFHYAYMPEAVTYTVAALVTMTGKLDDTVDSYDAAQVAGATEFIINGDGDGDPVENAYAGGYVMIWTLYTLGRPQLRILKSTAAAYTAAYPTQYSVTLTLEQGLPSEVAANTECDVFPSRYADCRTAFGSVNQGGYRPFVGMPPRVFTAERYGWLQTYGPVFIVNTLTDDLGLGGNQFNRTAVFAGDGSIRPCHTEWDDGSSQQIAGYSLVSASTTGSPSGWIMLTLDR